MPRDKDFSTGFEPLVTAAEMYPALERLCLSATEELLLSFRIFDPLTQLRSPEARDRGLSTWVELIDHLGREGIRIRILLADFDPVFTPELHQDAWRAARIFGQRQTPNVEVLCAPHEGKTAPIWKRLFASKIKQRLDRLRQFNPSQLTPLQQQALQGKITLRPATLHQKFALADGARAIIGGIDVDERRWDDERHDRPAAETWHDVSLRIADRVVGDIRRHFADCWSRALRDKVPSFGIEASEVAETRALPRRQRLAMGPRLLRTVSRRSNGSLRIGPVPEVTEHEEAHQAAFESAEDLIYVETQFFRHMPLARALARRAHEKPDLQLVLLMPTEPERVLFSGADGMDARHGQSLQLHCLSTMRAAFGDRMSVLAPVQPRRADDDAPGPVNGAEVVYLHSKVTLVDEKVGILGSANLNGRSMRWDTEASLQFQNPAHIRALRQRLQATWLRGAADRIDPRKASEWTRLAREEAALPPEQRETYIQLWPEARNRRFARFLPVLPAEMF